MKLQIRTQSLEVISYLAVLLFAIGFVTGVWLLLGDYLPSSYTVYQIILPQIVLVGLVMYLILENQNRLRSVLADSQSLQNSHERYQHLYNSCPVPYLNVNRQGDISMANNASTRMIRAERAELVGTSLLARLSHEDATKLAIAVNNIKTGTSFNDAELQLRCNDGKILWVSVSGFTFSKREDMFVTILDIDHKKTVDTAKTEFVSLASHQLRTPISTTQWAMAVLNEELTDTTPKQTEYLSKVTKNLDRLAQLVDDFMRVSKFELGTFTTRREQVAVHEELATLIDQYEARITQKRVHVAISLEPDTLYVHTDPQLFRMIIGNLLSNAIKYSHEAGDISIQGYLDYDDMVLVIKDEEIGIPFADQPGLFDKFHRATNAKLAKIAGNGLGLYIVKEAIGVLEGEIDFESKEDAGTTFEVRLPTF